MDEVISFLFVVGDFTMGLRLMLVVPTNERQLDDLTCGLLTSYRQWSDDEDDFSVPDARYLPSEELEILEEIAFEERTRVMSDDDDDDDSQDDEVRN